MGSFYSVKNHKENFMKTEINAKKFKSLAIIVNILEENAHCAAQIRVVSVESMDEFNI